MPRVLALLLLFACMGEGIAQPVRATDAAMAAQVDAAMALPGELRQALAARKPEPGLTAEERVQRLVDASPVLRGLSRERFVHHRAIFPPALRARVAEALADLT